MCIFQKIIRQNVRFQFYSIFPSITLLSLQHCHYWPRTITKVNMMNISRQNIKMSIIIKFSFFFFPNYLHTLVLFQKIKNASARIPRNCNVSHSIISKTPLRHEPNPHSTNQRFFLAIISTKSSLLLLV